MMRANGRCGVGRLAQQLVAFGLHKGSLAARNAGQNLLTGKGIGNKNHSPSALALGWCKAGNAASVVLERGDIYNNK